MRKYILLMFLLISAKGLSQGISVNYSYNNTTKALAINIANQSNKEMTILNAKNLYDNRSSVRASIRDSKQKIIYNNASLIMGLKGELQPKTIYKIPPFSSSVFYVYIDQIDSSQAEKIYFQINITYYYLPENKGYKFLFSKKDYDY